jgi:TPR repeat protein
MNMQRCSMISGTIISIFYFGMTVTLASAESPDKRITDCDTYAASEVDPQHIAAGVAYDRIDAVVAISACEDAVRKHPNNARLIFQLGRSYDKGNNLGVALSQYRRAADLGHAVAKFNIGNMYASGRGVPKDNAKAGEWYRLAALQGLHIAQKQIGATYYLGEGATQSYTEALKWYQKAADGGDAEAQNNVGSMYESGRGVEQNFAEAAKWYRKAADQGQAVAQHNLGVLYSNGKGVPQNDAEALKWYRKAADQGNVKGQVSLGFMYYTGKGVAQDYGEAAKWFRDGADLGDLVAQKNLGGMYYKGEGTPQNYSEAMKWLRKAADQGDAYSQNTVGAMYEAGNGVPENPAEALRWYRKAAEQGEPLAQSNLAILNVRFPQLLPERANQSTPKVSFESEKPFVMPESEKLLIAAVQKARAAYAAGANEMAQGAARPARAKAVCGGIKNLQVNDWIGEVQTLSSNSDGLGVLSIQIAEGIVIKTWNNAISDTSAKTLLDPESPVFKKAVLLKKGQRVKFAGQFIRDETDCFREGSLTLKGSIAKPEYIFRFSDVVGVE